MKANRKIIFRRKLVAVAVASCFTVTPAFANPIGATVVNGQVGFATQGSTLTVTNSPNAIINWQQFSINTGETTRFIQQSAQSAVLNRVVGQDPSQLLGSLLSNGRVYLINPNGILFGQGAVIDVGGLVASTLKLTDGDFLAGRLNFTDGVGAGGINNQGSITTPTGGNVYLIAPDITNSGVITSPQGEILLAAGHTVNLMDTTNPNVQVTVGAPDTQAVNIGSLIARSGKVGIYGALIDQQGLVDANTAVVGANGKITLKANQRVDAGGTISAQGAGGGTINVMADMQSGTVNVTGTLDASAPNSGNGGFIETSAAHVQVADTAHVTTLAAHGNIGTWLIDPNNFTISASGDMTGAAVSSTLGSTNLVIQTTTMGTPGGNGDIFVYDNITKTANTGGTTTLTLQAENSIIVEPTVSISSTVGALNVVFNADSDGLNGGNIQMMSGSSIVTNGGNITLGGGTPLLGLPSGAAVGIGTLTSADASGIYLDGATLNAGGGNISMVGTGAAGTTFGADGIYATDTTIGSIQPTVIRTAGAGTITMNGTGGAGPTYNSGVRLGLNTQVSTVDGAISITGQGGNGSDHNIGVYVHDNATITATGAGDIILNGTGGAGTYRDYGVRLSSSAQITTNTGDISITGQGAGGGSSNYAIIHTDTSGPITSTAGNIILTGMGAGDAGTISLSGAINAVSGDINISGVNLNIIAGSNSPITITAGHDFIATLTGTMLLQGGNAGNNQDASVKVHGGTVNVTAGSVSILGGTANASVADGGSPTAVANAELSADTTLDITTTSGGLTVQAGIAHASASCCSSSMKATATANATLKSGGDMTLIVANGMTVQGGSALAEAKYFSGSSLSRADATADAMVSAGGKLDLTVQAGSLNVQGGSSASAYAWGGSNQTANANANATLKALGTAGMKLDVANGITVHGGNNASATASCYYASCLASRPNVATTNANALISAPNGLLDITVHGGGLTVQGGNNAFARATDSGTNFAKATANAAVQAGSLDITLAGPLLVQGGSHASAGTNSFQAGDNTAIVEANALLHATGDIINLTVTTGDVTIAGGNNASASGTEGHGIQDIRASANAELSAGGDITLTVSNGNLSVKGGDYASASVSASSVSAQLSATTNANAKLAAGNNLTLDVSGGITVAGGNYASASASGSGSSKLNNATAHADALLSAGNLLTITNATGLTVQGGYGASASASDRGVNTATATANATVQAGSMDITLAGPLTVQGGNGASASANCWWNCANAQNTATAHADALIFAAGALTINNATGLTVQGGYGASASASYYGVNTATATANATVHAGSMDITLAGPLTVQGGSAASAHARWGSANAQNTATAQADALLSATGALIIRDATGLTVQAGSANAYANNGSGPAARTTPDASAYANATMSAGSLTLRANDLTIRGGGAHAEAGSTGSPVSYRSATAEARALVSVGTVSELTLGNKLLIEGLGCHSSCTAIVNGAGGVNSAFADRSAFLRVVGDISSLTVGGGGVTIWGGDANATTGGTGANTATENADAGIKVGGSMSISTATGDLRLTGGSAYVSGPGAAAHAVALIESGTTLSGTMNVDVGGNVWITGGYGGNYWGPGALAFAGIVNTGPINMTIGGATGLTFTGGDGGATYNGWTVPGTGLSPDPTSAISITYTGGGGLVTTLDSWLDSAFIMTRMSALPPAVLGAVDFGTNTLNNSINFTAFIEPIHFGEEHEDEKNEKPVCR